VNSSIPVYFPFACILNISLLKMVPQKYGLASHHVSLPESHITANTSEHMLIIQEKHLEERRAHSPPVQAGTKKGGMIIREPRLWPVGMPNKTEEPSRMLAFVVQPAWFDARSKSYRYEMSRS
jgi:hypothetical protein